jgi:hypothetical protein
MISDKAMKVLWEEGITKDQVLEAIADIPLARTPPVAYCAR